MREKGKSLQKSGHLQAHFYESKSLSTSNHPLTILHKLFSFSFFFLFVSLFAMLIGFKYKPY